MSDGSSIFHFSPKSDRKFVVTVVPTYNEAENIPKLISRFSAVREESESNLVLLFIDDSSPDGSGKIISEFVKTHDFIGLVERESKDGLGKAYVHGFEVAISEGADVVIQMDADLSHDPSIILDLQKKIDEGSDVAIASRYIQGGGVEGWPLMRKVTSAGGNIYAKWMMKLGGIKDCTSGFRAIDSGKLRNVLERNDEFSSGYVFQIELLASLLREGADVGEVPMIFKEREYGESKLGATQILQFIRKLFMSRLTGKWR